jgi:hypothetical protein
MKYYSEHIAINNHTALDNFFKIGILKKKVYLHKNVYPSRSYFEWKCIILNILSKNPYKNLILNQKHPG